jgi:serine/threonine protein kinase/formylglycine-generating enzyme required for sulfatase activity
VRVALSISEFLKRLDESGVMTSADARAFLAALKIDASAIDGEQLAKRLVKQKKLSAYQAQAVYSGKGKSLTMGSYFVLDKLGQGGMGMVLKAEHRMMKRLVAIKVLSPAVTGTKELQQRFRREVEAAARLTHPNIVAAFDAGEVDGSPFLVMEYVPGDDLQAIVKREGPLGVDQAIHCIVQAAKGLEFAHTHGVIHRDIKPANLLLDTSGTVKILDMGLARIEANDIRTQSELTGTGAVMGTVDYMAPEQAVSTKHADLRSDLYSLGISLWYLLTARSAYEGDSMMARLLAHRDQPIPSLRAVRDDVSESLDAVFRKSVAKNANDRYQSASAFMADLEACRTGASVKAMTVAEVSTGNDEFHDFLKNLENPTQAVTGIKPDSAYTPTLITSEPSLTTTREIRPNTSARRTSVPERRKREALSPPQKPPSSRMLLGGGAGALLLLLAVVFFLRTPYGTLRVEILDPEVELAIKGTEITLRAADIEPVSLKTGEKKLIITRGDLSFETETFVLKKEAETRVKVELIGDQLVVNGDGRILAEKSIPQSRVTSSTTGGNADSSKSPSSDISSQMPKPLWPESVTDLPAGFVPLFNGMDLAGWKGEVGDPQKRSLMTPAELAFKQIKADERMRSHWRVENGVLTFDGKGDNLCTIQDYSDFELYLEWNITPGGDSGVYLRGSPQVQIWDSAVKQNGNGVGSGGLYNNTKHSAQPLLNADKPIGEWNAMFIRMIGDKVTVSLNGQPVVDNVVYENFVEPDKPIYASGPIELQKFGSPLQFRNVLIRRINSSVNPNGVVDSPPPAIAPFDAAQARAHQEAWAKRYGVPVEYTNSIGMKFRLIPPGEFMMGSPQAEIDVLLKMLPESDSYARACFVSEGPQHKAILTKPFYLAVNEVTQEQYEKVQGRNPSFFSKNGVDKELAERVAKLDTARHPVEGVIWTDAAEFIQKLGNGYRLPTEAEWEFACRAGSTSRYSHRVPEDGLSGVAWWAENSGNRTHPVGELQASPFGLHDMRGGVWEWVSDAFDLGDFASLGPPPGVDPQDAAFNDRRVIRGGSWSNPAILCRSASRVGAITTHRVFDVGIRVALSVDTVRSELAETTVIPSPAIRPLDAQ